jgi:hypothetical protein
MLTLAQPKQLQPTSLDNHLQLQPLNGPLLRNSTTTLSAKLSTHLFVTEINTKSVAAFLPSKIARLADIEMDFACDRLLHSVAPDLQPVEWHFGGICHPTTSKWHAGIYVHMVNEISIQSLLQSCWGHLGDAPADCAPSGG